MTAGPTRTPQEENDERSIPARSDAARAGLRNYVLVTGAYWADTVTDGATRMLVLFYFYNLGYTPLAVASLFIFL
jgi:hypothetical protein